MKIIRTFSILLFLFSQINYGQGINDKVIQGKITVDSVSVYGINVLNLMNQKTAVANIDGVFFVLAKAKDILVFTSSNIETNTRIIGSADIEVGVLSIKMRPRTIKLKEVIVNKNEFSVLSLGIVNKEPTRYSSAERKLKTAGDFKPIMLLGLLGGGMELDPLINKINGRTKRLKKLVVLERKEINIKLISELYDNEYFTSILSVPIEYVAGFKYYLVENESFVKILENKNKIEISFYMIPLDAEFKILLNTKN